MDNQIHSSFNSVDSSVSWRPWLTEPVDTPSRWRPEVENSIHSPGRWRPWVSEPQPVLDRTCYEHVDMDVLDQTCYDNIDMDVELDTTLASDLGDVIEPTNACNNVSLDVSIPEPRSLPDVQENPPWAFFVQKGGLQSGNDSYHDNHGHTYRRKPEPGKDHLGSTYVCIFHLNKTKTRSRRMECHGRVLYRNGEYKLTVKHDICNPYFIQ